MSAHSPSSGRNRSFAYRSGLNARRTSAAAAFSSAMRAAVHSRIRATRLDDRVDYARPARRRRPAGPAGDCSVRAWNGTEGYAIAPCDRHGDGMLRAVRTLVDSLEPPMGQAVAAMPAEAVAPVRGTR